jgi:G:T-mismatch repair DNA endonuclease (very short patch repair protein)
LLICDKTGFQNIEDKINLTICNKKYQKGGFMRIIDKQMKNDNHVRQAAKLLVDGFKRHWPEANGPGKPDIILGKRVSRGGE